jgi:hypothetical protein
VQNTQPNFKNFDTAMAVLSSFWWMFNKSIDCSKTECAYGDKLYVFAFEHNWKEFMSDLEDKNEELHSILSELTDKQIKEMAGE